MLGGIVGDKIGSPYEYEQYKIKRDGLPVDYDKRMSFLESDTSIFDEDMMITDDSIHTIAVADAVVSDRNYGQKLFDYSMPYMNIERSPGQSFKNYFGGRFIEWLSKYELDNNYVGESIGNGSAMRVSPVGYHFDNLEDVLKNAALSAIPSHNSMDAIKGAQAVATTIFLGKNGVIKEHIKNFIENHFDYDLNLSLDKLQRDYRFNATCEGSVREAIFVLLQSNDFEDAIRKSLSIGGDTDTITCMVGSMAEGYYGIPRQYKAIALKNLPESYISVLSKLYNEDLTKYSRVKKLGR